MMVEQRALVYATVRETDVDDRLLDRYWEVWLTRRRCGWSEQLDAAVDAWCVGEAGVGRERRGRADHLGQGDVRGVVRVEIVPECPHSWSEAIGREAGQGQAGEAVQRGRTLLLAATLFAHESAVVGEARSASLFEARRG